MANNITAATVTNTVWSPTAGVYPPATLTARLLDPVSLIKAQSAKPSRDSEMVESHSPAFQPNYRTAVYLRRRPRPISPSQLEGSVSCRWQRKEQHTINTNQSSGKPCTSCHKSTCGRGLSAKSTKNALVKKRKSPLTHFRKSAGFSFVPRHYLRRGEDSCVRYNTARLGCTYFFRIFHFDAKRYTQLVCDSFCSL